MKGFKTLNVGFGNTVVANRIVAVVRPDSAPSRRLRRRAEESMRLIDATSGRKTRALVILDSGHVVLSGIQAETIAGRLESDDCK